jgi:hypothetical protein
MSCHVSRYDRRLFGAFFCGNVLLVRSLGTGLYDSPPPPIPYTAPTPRLHPPRIKGLLSVEAEIEHRCVDIEKAVPKMQQTAKRDDAERRSLDESDHGGFSDLDDGDDERATATWCVGGRPPLQPHKRKRCILRPGHFFVNNGPF